MKYLVLLIDGVADTPVPQLHGKTPLETANKPHIDRLAQSSEIGMVQTVPQGLPPGSDVANLSVLGYDPLKYYTGRSPLEAVSIGVDLKPEDVAFRCNLVTLSEEPVYSEKTMIDYSSDEITTDEAAQLIATLASQLNSETIRFYSGVSYRHLMVWHNGPVDSRLTPPHDISDKVIGPYLPSGPGADILLTLMEQSRHILKDHPINEHRKARGLRPATSIWLWGQGKKPQIDSFAHKYGLKGATISAVDLIKGLGICAGLEAIDVPGATGNIHTNFRGKAEAAVEAFRRGKDFIYLHFEAADEAGHRGEIENKVLSIEKIDAEVLGPILNELPRIDPEFRVMILPDHPTPLGIKTHTADPVPYLIYDSLKNVDSGVSSFDEASAARTRRFLAEGHLLMDRFILNA